MKIQTKSGFVCEVNENLVADWDFLDLLCDSESDNESTRIRASRDAVKFLLGKDGAAALADHVKDEKGVKSSARVFEEFKEIMTLLGENSKKSESSQS